MNTLNVAYGATLVDEWVAAGVRHAVVAPGSRSAPLAIALHRDPRIAVQVVLDERTAAFVALGIGRATGMPAIVVCTSGSAAAHFHPAVIEADHGDVPLLVCTADRPTELLDTGAGQTIDQHGLYGPSVRWFAAPGAPDTERPEVWRSIAARSVARACGPRPGPVHLNLAFRDPLVGPDAAGPLGRPGPATITAPRTVVATDLDDLARRCIAAERGLLVVGWGSGLSDAALDELAAATGWPVLADTISGLRTAPAHVAHYEALVRHTPFANAHRPDLVVRFGAPLTSKVVTQWFGAEIEQIVVDPNGRRLDPHRVAARFVEADADPFAHSLARRVHEVRGHHEGSASTWTAAWHAADGEARRAVASVLGAHGASGAALAAAVFAALPDGTEFSVASSMAVRDLEWFAQPRTGVRVHANRGANGIDGLVATATGIALGSAAPTVVLLGDLAAHHDIASLQAAVGSGANLTIVVADNGGGGIFSFLPQAEHCSGDEFEALFGTPQPADLVALAEAFGARATRVDALSAPDAVRAATVRPGVDVVVVPTLARDADVVVHRTVWDAVGAALG